MKKVTKATFKKFLRENENLFVNCKREFDGMTDCCESRNAGWRPAGQVDWTDEHRLGIGIYLVGYGRDYFKLYEQNGYSGFRLYNCCGSWIVARRTK